MKDYYSLTYCLRNNSIFSFFFLRQNFTKQGAQEAVRCDTVVQLQKGGCTANEIISPKNYKNIVKEEPLSASSNDQDPVQMSPQEIRLKLRPGQWK